MRDIRRDIKERLDVVEQERQRLKARLEEIDEEEQMLQGFLAAENARWHNQQPTLFTPSPTGNGQVQLAMPSLVTHFLIKALNDGTPWSLERLKERAEKRGVLLGGQSPGRTLHGGLLGLKKRGVVEIVERGVWRLVNKDASTGEPVEAPRNVGVVSGDPRRT